MSIGWLLAASLAWAGGFTLRESRDPLPAREVARDLVLPKGWSTVALAATHARWDDTQVPRPFPGAVRRTELSLAARLSLGDRVEIRGRMPWVDVRTGGPLGSGWGAAEVGAAWSLARGVAPARSAAVALSWTAPDGHPRLPLGSATHRLRAEVAGRWKVGALRATGAMWGELTPSARVDWLRDAQGQRLALDPADGVGGRGELLLQAGPLLGRVGGEAGWLGPDRVDGVVVTGAGLAASLRAGGGVQLTRGVQLGVVAHGTPRPRTAWFAPLPTVSHPGRGLRGWLEVAL